jgi:hypoxanthine-guanine phosphoribosyltransferase
MLRRTRMGDTATLRLVRSEQEIEADVCRLAREIARDYRGKEVVLVGALTGAFVFMADRTSGERGGNQVDTPSP